MTDKKIVEIAMRAVQKFDENARHTWDWSPSEKRHKTDRWFGVIIAEWNQAPDGLEKKLESIGFDLGYPDDTDICDHCGNAIAMTYETPCWVDCDNGGIICARCTRKEFMDDYIDYCKNSPVRIVVPPIVTEKDLEKKGWQKVNDKLYEIGLHPGQNDQPEKILRECQERWPGYDFVFRVDEANQFEIRFDVWRKLDTDSVEVIPKSIRIYRKGKEWWCDFKTDKGSEGSFLVEASCAIDAALKVADRFGLRRSQAYDIAKRWLREYQSGKQV